MDFKNVKFKQAIQFLLQKNPIATERWDDLSSAAHGIGFMVAGVTNLAMLNDIKAALLSAQENGTTFEQFKKEFRAIANNYGWSYKTNQAGYRERLIFNTNIGQARAAGREEQMADPALREKYLAVYKHGNSRAPRPEHLAYDGMALELDNPFWDTHSPKNGYGCSCEKFLVKKDKAEAKGYWVVKKDSDIPNWGQTYIDSQGRELPVGVEHGFNTRPGNWENVQKFYKEAIVNKIKEYPPAQQEAIKKYFKTMLSPDLANRFPAKKIEDLTPLLIDFSRIYPNILPTVTGAAETKLSEQLISFEDGKFLISSLALPDNTNPAELILSALNDIRLKDNLSFEQERMLVQLYRAILRQNKDGIGDLKVEWLALNTYQRFLKALGNVKPLHQSKIKTEGEKKPIISSFKQLLNDLKINETFLNAFFEASQTDEELAQLLAVASGNLDNLAKIKQALKRI